jgi:hypothetical protein
MQGRWETGVGPLATGKAEARVVGQAGPVETEAEPRALEQVQVRMLQVTHELRMIHGRLDGVFGRISGEGPTLKPGETNAASGEPPHGSLPAIYGEQERQERAIKELYALVEKLERV